MITELTDVHYNILIQKKHDGILLTDRRVEILIDGKIETIPFSYIHTVPADALLELDIVDTFKFTPLILKSSTKGMKLSEIDKHIYLDSDDTFEIHVVNNVIISIIKMGVIMKRKSNFIYNKLTGDIILAKSMCASHYTFYKGIYRPSLNGIKIDTILNMSGDKYIAYNCLTWESDIICL
jgi:hypothetical protein